MDSLLHRHSQSHPRTLFPAPSPHPLSPSSWQRISTNCRVPLPRSSCVCRANLPAMISNNQTVHDLAMGVVTIAGSLTALKFWDFLAKRNAFSQNVSRKLVHISIGMIFMLFWPLFSDGDSARYIAAFSVIINGLRVLALGFGILKDDATVKAMTRDGNPEELLKGPFYYAMTITFATICVWRSSPLAPIMIANLCAGDGFADLIGRRFGSAKIPYNENKSYIGSLAMLMFGFIFCIGYEYYFSYFGFYTLSTKLVISTFVISLVTTFVESLPISTVLDDNFTVPLTSFIVGKLLL